MPCSYKTECGQELISVCVPLYSNTCNYFLGDSSCSKFSIISFIMENLSDQGLILLVRFKPRSKEEMFLTTVNIILDNKPLRK